VAVELLRHRLLFLLCKSVSFHFPALSCGFPRTRNLREVGAVTFSTMVIPQKVGAFRDFATQLALQVVEQLCVEYEREVSQLYNDCLVYRHELERVAALLGAQLLRERELHNMLEKMADHQGNIASSAQMLAQQSPNSQQLHELVDQLVAQHQGILGSTLQGMSQAHSVAHAHAAHAKQLQEPLISAENELVRITSMLQTPMINEVTPAPTVAQLPGTGVPYPGQGGSLAMQMPGPPPTYAPGPMQGPISAQVVASPPGMRQATSYSPPVSVQSMGVAPTTYVSTTPPVMMGGPRMR